MSSDDEEDIVDGVHWYYHTENKSVRCNNCKLAIFKISVLMREKLQHVDFALLNIFISYGF